MSCKRIRIGSLFPGVSISPTVIGLVIKKQDPRNLNRVVFTNCLYLVEQTYFNKEYITHHKMINNKEAYNLRLSIGLYVEGAHCQGLRNYKQSVKERMESTSGDRWVFNLTIRDSPYDTANVSFWGSQQFVIQVDSQIEVGSIVGITNVKLSPASPGGDQYKPKVTCGSHLQVSENGGEIQVYDKNHELLGYGMGEMLKQLIHLPNGPVQESLTVADIRAGSEGLDRSSANLLVAVQKVGAERIFRTRDGRDAVRLDVTCFDQSGCNLHLVMWDRCDIQFAKTWVPFQTILFISDACLKWDTFRCGLIVQLTSRSICTVQPDCEEGRNLLQYAISAEGLLDDIVDEGSRFEPDFNTDLSKISRIFNVEQLKEVTSQIGKGRHLDAVLYCFFSEFDIDSENTSIFSGSCGVCGGRVSRQSSNYYACSDLECDGSSYAGKHHLNFDIRVTLSDSTGSINNCRLTGIAAERLFGMQPEAFMNLAPHELTMIKWQFLLERCKVFISAAPKKSDQSQADIWILFAERANLDEVTVRCSAA